MWISLEKSADLNLRSTVEQAVKTQSLAKEERRHGVRAVVEYLADIVEFRGSRGASGLGQWCTLAYLGSKLLYVTNIFMQIYFLDFILGHGHSCWALTAIRGATDGGQTPETGIFLCDFEVRTLGKVQNKTAQCSLAINMLNEKVFVVVYVWLAFLLFPTVLSFAYSAAVVTVPFLRLWLVRRCMAASPLCTLSDTPTAKFDHCKAHRRLKKFVFHVLGMDGFLLLRFVEAHAGNLTASEVARGLFKQCQEHQATPFAHVNACNDDGSGFDDAKQSFLARKDEAASPLK